MFSIGNEFQIKINTKKTSFLLCQTFFKTSTYLKALFFHLLLLGIILGKVTDLLSVVVFWSWTYSDSTFFFHGLSEERSLSPMYIVTCPVPCSCKHEMFMSCSWKDAQKLYSFAISSVSSLTSVLQFKVFRKTWYLFLFLL